MAEPLAKKFFPLRGFNPKGVEVIVWKSESDLNAALPDFNNEISLAMSKNGKEAKSVAAHQPKPFDSSSCSIRTRGKTNSISTLHFTVEFWGFEIITHELIHLVFWMQEYLGIEALTNMYMQEKWCYAIGELSEQIALFIQEQDKVSHEIPPQHEGIS